MGPREPLDRLPGGSKDKVSIHSSHSLHASFTNPRVRQSLGDERSVARHSGVCKLSRAVKAPGDTGANTRSPRRSGGGRS